MCPSKICPAEVCLAEVRAAEVGSPEIRSADGSLPISDWKRLAAVRSAVLRFTPRSFASRRSAQWKPPPLRSALLRSALQRLASAEVLPAELRTHVTMFSPPPVPLLDPLLEDCEMFRVRHGRVTSLASAMLRMILPGPQTAKFTGRLSWRSMIEASHVTPTFVVGRTPYVDFSPRLFCRLRSPRTVLLPRQPQRSIC